MALQGKLREVQLKKELEAVRAEKADVKKELDDALLQIDQVRVRVT